MKLALSKRVSIRLSQAINEECAAIAEEKRRILLSKIERINQVTNNPRLRRPFGRLHFPNPETISPIFVEFEAPLVIVITAPAEMIVP